MSNSIAATRKPWTISHYTDDGLHFIRDNGQLSNYFAMVITRGGSVGIGRTNPQYLLDVAEVVNASGGFYQYSDVRLKENIRTSPGLDVISRLRGVLFDWKEDGAPSAGVIAQEVEKVMAEAVSTDTDGTTSVNYNALIAPLIEAVQEQQAEIESLKSDNAALKRDIEELRSAIGTK